jgi:hypothetical protein
MDYAKHRSSSVSFLKISHGQYDDVNSILKERFGDSIHGPRHEKLRNIIFGSPGSSAYIRFEEGVDSYRVVTKDAMENEVMLRTKAEANTPHVAVSGDEIELSNVECKYDPETRQKKTSFHNRMFAKIKSIGSDLKDAFSKSSGIGVNAVFAAALIAAVGTGMYYQYTTMEVSEVTIIDVEFDKKPIGKRRWTGEYTVKDVESGVVSELEQRERRESFLPIEVLENAVKSGELCEVTSYFNVFRQRETLSSIHCTQKDNEIQKFG